MQRRGISAATDVVYLAKVQISKQITTYVFIILYQAVDVVYLAKVQISKQITTCVDTGQGFRQMLFTLQRYKFLSKSQHLRAWSLPVMDVVYLAKVQISKQITTNGNTNNNKYKMLFTLQRYKFLSKSQHPQESHFP